MQRSMEFQNKETSEEQQTKKWFGMVLIVAGIYFAAAGLSGAVLPLKEQGLEALGTMELLAAAAGGVGIVLIITGSVMYLRNEGRNRKKEKS